MPSEGPPDDHFLRMCILRAPQMTSFKKMVKTRKLVKQEEEWKKKLMLSRPSNEELVEL